MKKHTASSKRKKTWISHFAHYVTDIHLPLISSPTPYLLGGIPRPRILPRPRKLPRSPFGGPPPRGRLGGRSPRSLRVSTEMRTEFPPPQSMCTPPLPPAPIGRDMSIALRAASSVLNSRNAHALLRTISISLRGPNRVVSSCSSFSLVRGSTMP